MAPADAERATGYRVGGISPFGQKKGARMIVDRAALGFSTIFVSGGRRGLEIEVAPADLVRLLAAEVMDVT
jgi:Cys-tRNA(Pro)/Cys-tRNA(Cys) deacylase